MNDAGETKVNSIVQINPDHSKLWGGALAIVSEVRSWGVQGYVQMPSQGQAYVRLKWSDIELVGQAMWSVTNQEEEEEGNPA